MPVRFVLPGAARSTFSLVFFWHHRHLQQWRRGVTLQHFFSRTFWSRIIIIICNNDDDNIDNNNDNDDNDKNATTHSLASSHRHYRKVTMIRFGASWTTTEALLAGSTRTALLACFQTRLPSLLWRWMFLLVRALKAFLCIEMLLW
jgi:hypothetical protein